MAEIENGATNGASEIDYDLVSKTIRELFQKFLKENGITQEKIEIQAGTMRGDNFLGIIAKAEVTGKDKNGKDFYESYIIKSAPKSEGLRKFAPIALAYEREIYMYSTVLPAFKKFEEVKHFVVPFSTYAQCLRTSNSDKDEALIMKDMKRLGFVMQNRKRALDYNHIKLVITELAKLHAISFALRDQNPELFNNLASKMEKNYFTEMDVSAFEEHSDKQTDKAAGALNPDTDQEAIEKFKKFSETYIHNLTSILDDHCHPYSVIRHGDCWTNNFLFKYMDTANPKKPTSLCFLDWQLSHVGPPVLDIFYFMYACSDKEGREHFDEILQHYYDTLKERTRELGSNLEKLYPHSIFMEQMQKFGSYGMAIAVMLLQFLLSDGDEIPDINKIFDEDPMKAMESFNVTSRNDELYHERLRDIILHAVDRKYI